MKPTAAHIAYEAWVRSKESPEIPPTPGQIAYEAFDAEFPADRFVRIPWTAHALRVQEAWEAAAQAVLDAAKARVDAPSAPLPEGSGL